MREIRNIFLIFVLLLVQSFSTPITVAAQELENKLLQHDAVKLLLRATRDKPRMVLKKEADLDDDGEAFYPLESVFSNPVLWEVNLHNEDASSVTLEVFADPFVRNMVVCLEDDYDIDEEKELAITDINLLAVSSLGTAIAAPNLSKEFHHGTSCGIMQLPDGVEVTHAIMKFDVSEIMYQGHMKKITVFTNDRVFADLYLSVQSKNQQISLVSDRAANNQKSL